MQAQARSVLLWHDRVLFVEYSLHKIGYQVIQVRQCL